MCVFGRRGALDVASRRVCLAAPLATAGAAGQEGDEDAEEGDDAVDDGVEDSTDAGDDGHDGVSDGAEEASDLKGVLAEGPGGARRGGEAYARDDGTHCE